MFKQFSTLFLFYFFTINVVYAVSADTGYKLQDQATEFELKALDGDVYTLASLKSKGHVLLVFWATECVYCYAHVADFKKLQQQYGEKGLTLAAINIGGEYDVEVKEYVKDNALNYLILSNRLKNLDVAEAYHVIGTPTLVLVSPQGEIIYRGHDIPDISQWITQ